LAVFQLAIGKGCYEETFKTRKEGLFLVLNVNYVTPGDLSSFPIKVRQEVPLLDIIHNFKANRADFTLNNLYDNTNF
jgi:hypothetical protein